MKSMVPFKISKFWMVKCGIRTGNSISHDSQLNRAAFPLGVVRMVEGFARSCLVRSSDLRFVHGCRVVSELGCLSARSPVGNEGGGMRPPGRCRCWCGGHRGWLRTRIARRGRWPVSCMVSSVYEDT